MQQMPHIWSHDDFKELPVEVQGFSYPDSFFTGSYSATPEDNRTDSRDATSGCGERREPPGSPCKFHGTAFFQGQPRLSEKQFDYL